MANSKTSSNVQKQRTRICLVFFFILLKLTWIMFVSSVLIVHFSLIEFGSKKIKSQIRALTSEKVHWRNNIKLINSVTITLVPVLHTSFKQKKTSRKRRTGHLFSMHRHDTTHNNNEHEEPNLSMEQRALMRTEKNDLKNFVFIFAAHRIDTACREIWVALMLSNRTKTNRTKTGENKNTI